jgi:BirA family biotin operon repressor/biotin-[acetyl-CoA-carboxylase] ligase
MPSSLAVPPPSAARALDGWTLHEWDEVSSTNLAAAALPPWSAVRAEVQRAGRGRQGRPWVSDRGGLWFSAVLPTPGNTAPWALLPLAAGWAVLSAVRELGLSTARLRWPNDILVDRRKLAGILVDKFSSDAAVVGIGLNVFNHPAAADPALADQAICLADLLPAPPPPSDLLALLLPALAREHQRLEAGDAAALCHCLQNGWRPGRVQLTLTGSREILAGFFEGVDALGRLLLRGPTGAVQSLSPHHVDLLRETF